MRMLNESDVCLGSCSPLIDQLINSPPFRKWHKVVLPSSIFPLLRQPGTNSIVLKEYLSNKSSSQTSA